MSTNMTLLPANSKSESSTAAVQHIPSESVLGGEDDTSLSERFSVKERVGLHGQIKMDFTSSTAMSSHGNSTLSSTTANSASMDKVVSGLRSFLGVSGMKRWRRAQTAVDILDRYLKLKESLSKLEPWERPTGGYTFPQGLSIHC